jgi:methionyl-tRNA formyltransferase
MKIVFYGYRDWALDIFNNVDHKNKYLVTCGDYNILETIKPDLVFFIGWSEIIPNHIIHNHTCICLHPSPLPKYRGGSPIQHQIINGEVSSVVSLFIMDEGLDTGDIVYQKEFDLDGTLGDIFQRIVDNGSIGINEIIDSHPNINRTPQNTIESTTFRRRKPSDSEITPDDITNSEPKVLYNKIRSLNNPYPNAFIRCRDGIKLYLIDSRY